MPNREYQGEGPPLNDGLTRAEVWKLLDTYQTQWKERFDRHANALDRNTTAMTDGFNSIRAAMELHAEGDRAVEMRVHDLEERAKQIAETVTKRTLLFSGVISAIFGPLSAWIFAKMSGR